MHKKLRLDEGAAVVLGAMLEGPRNPKSITMSGTMNSNMGAMLEGP